MIHILNPMYTVEKDVAFYTTCLWKQSRKDRMRYRIILWEVIAKKKHTSKQPKIPVQLFLYTDLSSEIPCQEFVVNRLFTSLS